MNILGGLAKTALIVGVLTLSGIAHARSPIPVTECRQVLDVRDGEYVLTPALGVLGCGDIGGPITIAANGIHLNTAGVTVDAIGDGIHINDGLSDIVIDGGGILGGGGGLSIGKDHNIRVEGLSLHGETDLGGSMADILINGASDVAITRCDIFASDTYGVKMNSASAVSVTTSKIPADVGIFASVTDGKIENNSLSVNAQGIIVTGRRNLIANNLVNTGIAQAASFDIGIQVAGRNRVMGNIVNNFFTGLELSGDSNVVDGNVINGAPASSSSPQSMYGIETTSGAVQNLVEKNLVAGNLNDLYESNGAPCVNVWRNNKLRHQWRHDGLHPLAVLPYGSRRSIIRGNGITSRM